MTSTLTDRYVAAVLRTVPGTRRPDIERELRASVADAVDDLVAAEHDPQDAEIRALSALGDPVRLAAQYTDRPLYLIGPGLYLDYVRVVGVLLATVAPLLAVGVGILRHLDGAGPGDVLTSAALGACAGGIVVVGWVTLAFVVAERSPGLRARRARPWSPASLPQLPGTRVDVPELLGGLAFLVLGTCLLVVFQVFSPVRDAGGDPVGVLQPALWDSGAPVLVLLFALARTAFDVVGYTVGWTTAHAVANTVLSVLFVPAVVWLVLTGRLLNDEFFRIVGWPHATAVPGVLTSVLVVLVVLVGARDTVDGFRRARRTSRRHRSEPLPPPSTRRSTSTGEMS
ncbi:permease prefix domain 1-containing protein [Oerskovia flava]|uniref:permease prefix domain 1-containing protein n=1 Tax=Oerskovia flava TaxID=2986422 RepID=UPI00223FFE3E|nr:permease prefix domain 1-containing protein [Oerskovia sp. JB1-3-2]